MSKGLDPKTYPCPDHPHIDLTEAVRSEVYADATLIIADMLPGAAIELGKQSLVAGVQTGPFLVGVDCHGRPAEGDGKPEPHRVYLHGAVR